MKNYYENEALKYIMYLDATTYMDGLRVNIYLLVNLNGYHKNRLKR